MNAEATLLRSSTVFTAGMIASLLISGCEYAIKRDVNKRLLRAMDKPKALTIIRAGFNPTDHQVGCTNSFFHEADSGSWRNDAGTPEQVSINGNVVQFHARLRDQRDNTLLTHEPLAVDLDLTTIDHVIEWTRPGRDTVRDGYLIEIDFDKGYEEIAPKHRPASLSAHPTSERTLYGGIETESSGAFLAAIRYLNPSASFIAAR